MGWEAIKGQDRVVTLLRHTVAQDHLPQAYLFLGPEGVGKKLVALALARVLNCTEQGTDFCGQCVHCRKVDKGLHPDVVLIEPQETSIKIEQIRQLQEQISYKPFEGRYKVWILDQAEKLTRQAANCLLKTLEEPPAHSLLILVASQASALLPTVVSRCQRVNFLRLTPPVLKQLLQEQGVVAPQALDLAVALAEGSMARAGQLQIEQFWAWREEMLSVLQQRQERWGSVFALGEKLAKDKPQIEQLVRLLGLWYRDLFALKVSAKADLLFNQDKCAQLSRQAEELDLALIHEGLGAIQDSFSALQRNANPRLVLENLLLKLDKREVAANEVTPQ